jgi:predicted HTH transcriptional regulator
MPSSVEMISNELDLSRPVVRKHLSNIIAVGCIKQVGMNKNAKLYISKNHKRVITDIMNNYDKIKKTVSSLCYPFTTKMIACELDLPYGMVKRYLRILRKENFIKQVYVEDGFKVYISNTYQGTIPPKKNSYSKIKSYISYLNKPFTVKNITCELDIGFDAVRKYLPAMLKEGYIKLIGTDKGSKVYVLNRNYGKRATK